jgi:hypothetical protein
MVAADGGGGGGERYAAWLGEEAAAVGVQSGQVLQVLRGALILAASWLIMPMIYVLYYRERWWPVWMGLRASVLQGKLMVSRHRPEEAWVRAPAGAADLFLQNRAHRGRAIHGDTVRPGF